MSYESATDLLGDVRRWDSNEWELRDVTAETYWAGHNGRITAAFGRAILSIQDAAARGDERGIRATQLLDRAERDIDRAARGALERQARGEHIEESHFQVWAKHGKVAVVHAVVGHLAESWIPDLDAELLTAGYRAADEKLDFDFTLETQDEQQWDAAKRFVDDVLSAYPGTAVTFDPPHRKPVGRFDVISTAYLKGDTEEARDHLIHDLESLLRRHDPEQRLGWPPVDLQSRRPIRF